MAYTHNDIAIGSKVKVCGFAGRKTVLEIIDGYRGIKVAHSGGPIWIDVEDVTAVFTR